MGVNKEIELKLQIAPKHLLSSKIIRALPAPLKLSTHAKAGFILLDFYLGRYATMD